MTELKLPLSVCSQIAHEVQLEMKQCHKNKFYFTASAADRFSVIYCYSLYMACYLNLLVNSSRMYDKACTNSCIIKITGGTFLVARINEIPTWKPVDPFGNRNVFFKPNICAIQMLKGHLTDVESH